MHIILLLVLFICALFPVLLSYVGQKTENTDILYKIDAADDVDKALQFDQGDSHNNTFSPKFQIFYADYDA